MDTYSNGEAVYIKAVVDRTPQDGQKLYRLVTERGTVIWASAEELKSKKPL